MDSSSIAPLPPGMVPSDSREDLRDLNIGLGKKDKDILPDTSVGGGQSEEPNVSPESPSRVPEKPFHAWKGPPEDTKSDSRNKDLEEIEKKMEKAKMVTSPFISSSLTQGHPSVQAASVSDRTTPRRIMSPIKRLNRVAPFESTPPKPKSKAMETFHHEAVEETEDNLDSNNASFIDHKLGSSFAEQVLGKVYSDNNQNKKEAKSEKPSEYIEPVVIIKTKSPGDEASIPAYSTVLKKHEREVKQSTPITSTSPSNVYEPEPSIDTSLIIGNTGAERSPEHHQTSGVAENDYTNSPDPLYSTIEETSESQEEQDQDMTDHALATYNSALARQLKKHDNKGTVQLISMKGKVGTTNGTGKFPKGSSVNLLALHYAAANGDKKALARVISTLPISQDTIEKVRGTENLVRRDEIDVEDSEGRTPLMHAVHNNQLEAVKMLVEYGANVNRAASDGSSALHQVAFSGSIEMIALLLSLGGDGTMRDNEGRTPLHWATNNPNAKAIELFLDKITGLDVNIRDGALMTPLMWAAYHCRPDHVQTLLERGADSALRDIDGMSAIHWSIHKHDTRVLQVLISGKSVLYSDNNGKTVMHQAAEHGSTSAVSMVIAVKPETVDILDVNGRTPLHWATACENPEVIRALLHYGADSSIADLSGKTALDYATEKGLHYCGLLLTKADALGSSDSYHSVLKYGTTSAMPGARAINSQEGQLLNIDEIKAALTSEQMKEIQTVCTGMWMHKFTNEGKGPSHSRYFWVNPSNIKLCWSQTKDSGAKGTKSDTLVGARSSASPVVFGRKDFDPLDKHKYAFTIFTSNRVLSVIARSSEDYKTWINGLQLVAHLGALTVTKLINTNQPGAGTAPSLVP